MKKWIAVFLSAMLAYSAYANQDETPDFTSESYDRIEVSWEQESHMTIRGDRQGRLVFHYILDKDSDEHPINVEIFESDGSDPFGGKEHLTGSYKLDLYDLYAWDGVLAACKNKDTLAYARFMSGTHFLLNFKFFQSGELVHEESYSAMGALLCVDVAVKKIRASNESL